MRLRKYGKKTVSVILACAMLGTSFAQYAFAEDAAETDVVVEQETQAAEVEEVGETQQESVTDAVDEFVADELSAEDAETAEDPADIADEQDGDASDEISLTVTDIEIASPTVTAYASGDSATQIDATTHLKYVESEEGVTITGLADDFDKTQTDLEIPSELGDKTVTKIGDGVFKDCENFTGKLTLPYGLEEIGNNVFNGCKFSGKLEFKSAIKKIGDNAFKGCLFEGKLSLLTKAESLEIGDGAFAGCGFTGELEIPSNVTSVGASAFEGCTGLTKLSIKTPASSLTIEEAAFKDCSQIQTIIFPESGLTKMSASIFEGCVGLTGKLEIPNSVTEIGASAFKGCNQLTGLTLPESGCISIGDSSFEGCTGLFGTLTLPTDLQTIGKNAFSDCGFTGELALPDTLTSIGEKAFFNCKGFTGDLNLENCKDLIDSKAFAGCIGFNGKLTLPDAPGKVANDAVFDSIRWKKGDAPIELQVGNATGITLETCASNSNLTLDSKFVTLTVDEDIEDIIVEIDNETNTITPQMAGETTITATAYNGTKITKKVVVIGEGANTPTVESASFAESAFRSDVLNLILNIKAKYVGVQALSGYFCLKTDTAQKISFSANWTKEPLYSSENEAGQKTIEVTIPASAAVGDYCLANLTLTNTAGVSTQYTYDATAGIWKNGAGNQVNITVGNDNTFTVKDCFGKTEGSVTVDIASPNAESLIKNMVEGNTAYASYNNNQHTASASLLNSIIGKTGSTLVLTNGIVEWGFYANKMNNNVTDPFDCLVALAGFDASIYGNAASTTLVTFKDNTKLPCEAILRIRADQLGGLYQQTGSVYVYTQDSTTKKLTDLTKQIPVSYVLSNGQYWYEFKVNVGTPNQLILSGKPLALTPSYKVTSITLSATSIAVAKGKKVTLTATAGPVGAANKAVVWTSSNTKVAKVNANGTITGKKYGKATITATAADGSGVVAKCTVRVGYKIKYKLNGGTNNAANPKAYYNQKVKLKNPTRPGYTFKGWYTDKNFKHSIKKIKKSYKKNLTLYAKWKKN